MKPILIVAEKNGNIKVCCEDAELQIYLIDQRFSNNGEPPILLKKTVEELNVDLLAKAYNDKT